QRCTFTFELGPYVTQQAKDSRHPDVEDVVVQRIDTDGAEDQNCREQYAIRHIQQLDPQTDQWQVQDDQHQIAYPHGHDQAPEQVGVTAHDLWARLNVVNGHGANHQRGDSVAWNP